MKESPYVLVVDDDPHIRDALGELLEIEGYRVECVSNGRAALDRLRSPSPPPAVVFLDLMMPEMDGFEFRRTQLGDPQLSGIPVVAMTAWGRETARRAQVDSYLLKPFRVEQLLTAVQMYCRAAV